ncbi:MAG: Holliday junction resolvase RuvX [Pirellulaceae bacterium]|nr:Holliday junction resolvase RuvX [Pirellulaceae bacterium]MDG2105272.1 Holliday junction resolvase RuvX [Pirellulaceae bacterium]
MHGRLAGVDYGTVRIGISISDADQTIASPLDNYNRRSPRLDDQYFQNLAEQERVVGFVVGLPVHSSGDESKKSKEARVFGLRIAKVTGLPVTWFDERYTSAHATQLLQQAGLTRKKRKQRLDKIAAQILLSTYLESSRQSETTGSIEDD